MIAKGNLHAHGVKLAAYLTTSSEDERAELVELRGFAADTIRDAFIDVQMQAAATRATKPFFHAYVRAPEGEALSRELWRAFADRLERQLGFDGQPRAVAFHHAAGGDTHMHIAWSRIDLASLKVIDPGLYKNKMKELCRAFEKEHGLTQVANERAADNRTRSANRAEFEQARRLGADLKAIRNTIRDCWQSADSGRGFVAALAEHGLILARGDRRNFVVIDRAGGDHALSKRITDATAAETRARMADLDRAALPSVAEAKAAQRAAHPDPRPARKGGKHGGARAERRAFKRSLPHDEKHGGRERGE
jgi:MobA/VirD2-like, nuclease domain